MARKEPQRRRDAAAMKRDIEHARTRAFGLTDDEVAAIDNAGEAEDMRDPIVARNVDRLYGDRDSGDVLEDLYETEDEHAQRLASEADVTARLAEAIATKAVRPVPTIGPGARKARLAARAEKNRDAVQQAMAALHMAAHTLLEEIAEKVDSFDPETMDWGHVGDLGYIVTMLRRAMGEED